MLAAWLVFSVAVALKLWRAIGLLRRPRPPAQADTEQFRQSLERSWVKQR
ncbi:MAG: hypothetical protein VKI83_04800 [Synechococcaceae cyanobacterium]|nr:hypothetical protein [Synechococcaceae cyanobacterium]